MNILGTEAAAEKLGVSVRRVRSLITEGKLVAHRVGRDYAIEEGALSAVVIHGKRGRPAKAKPEGEGNASELATETPAAELPDESSPKPKREKGKTSTATGAKAKRSVKKAKV